MTFWHYTRRQTPYKENCSSGSTYAQMDMASELLTQRAKGTRSECCTRGRIHIGWECGFRNAAAAAAAGLCHRNCVRIRTNTHDAHNRVCSTLQLRKKQEEEEV